MANPQVAAAGRRTDTAGGSGNRTDDRLHERIYGNRETLRCAQRRRTVVFVKDGQEFIRSSTGFSTFQTLSATILWPSAVGWMWSGWFSSGLPPTPSSRKGTSAA